jgi:hypothetical protein
MTGGELYLNGPAEEPAKTAERCYRLGLEAAKRQDLSAALRYGSFAAILEAEGNLRAFRPAEEPEQGGAARLVEICRYELGGDFGEGRELERIALLAGQKKWKAAARAARNLPRQTVRLLNIQGCLWALAKRYAPAADCFAGALAKDRGNKLAAEALAELGRRRIYFWRFF